MKETITILTLSKGRMKAEAEKVFKKNDLFVIIQCNNKIYSYIYLKNIWLSMQALSYPGLPKLLHNRSDFYLIFFQNF